MLLCVVPSSEVHSGGGWELETGNVKKTLVIFKSQPTKLHACLILQILQLQHQIKSDLYDFNDYLAKQSHCSLFGWNQPTRYID